MTAPRQGLAVVGGEPLPSGQAVALSAGEVGLSINSRLVVTSRSGLRPRRFPRRHDAGQPALKAAKVLKGD